MTDHKREERPREIVDYFCAEPTCKFYGKHTQQGVCHTTDPVVGDWDKLYEISEQFCQDLKDYRTQHIKDGADYIMWLESMYECTQLNWTFTLDECIRLRREVALLKLKVEKLERPTVSIVYLTPENCRHNRSIDPETGVCDDCGTVLP